MKTLEEELDDFSRRLEQLDLDFDLNDSFFQELDRELEESFKDLDRELEESFEDFDSMFKEKETGTCQD